MFKDLVINTVTNKYFWIGFVTATILFSHYIFGNDNALEQLGELIARILTGLNIDFSPKS